MKVIFLDVDGVLNGYNCLDSIKCKLMDILKSYNLCTNWYRNYRTKLVYVDEKRVKRLAKIVHSTGAKVVLSSSWRDGFWNIPYEKKSVPQKLLTDLFNKYDIQVIGITPNAHDGKRYKEIMSWLSKHIEVDGYVILDDEILDLRCFVGIRLVQTISTFMGKERVGLEREHIQEAINILNKEFIRSE